MAAFTAVAGVYALALRLDPLDVDAAQYAHIAQQMLATHSYLVIHNQGHPYLDKPPLTFWLTALSYAVFGVSAAASRIPSLVAAGVAWVSVGRLAALDFGRRAGWLAALLLASCQALFVMTNDCRTDTVLLGAVAFTLWQARAFMRAGGARALVLTGVGVGLAMLAKGPLGAVVPAFAVGSEIALRRSWRRLRSAAPLAVAGIALVMLVPMLVGLHRQFGMRGVTFFFWTQSFGRITGASSWHNHAGPLFLFHTLLWAFLPWTAMLLAAAWAAGRTTLRQRLRTREAGVGFALGGLGLTLAALSLSRYKLPHYAFVVLPFAAVLTGRWLDRLLDRDAPRARTVLLVTQTLVITGLAGLALWLCAVAFPLRSAVVGGVAAALFGAAALVTVRARAPGVRLVVPALLAILGTNVVVTGNLYPQALRYQSGSMAARLARARGIPPSRLGCLHRQPYSLDFAVGPGLFAVHYPADLLGRLRSGPVWLYTDRGGLRWLARRPVVIGPTIPLADYPVSRLNARFLNPATRPQVLRARYLVEVRAGPPAATSPSPRGSP